MRKRDFRSLWILRLNAAVRDIGLKYSVFVNLIKKADISINRKMLSYLAISEPNVFKLIVEKAQGKTV